MICLFTYLGTCVDKRHVVVPFFLMLNIAGESTFGVVQVKRGSKIKEVSVQFHVSGGQYVSNKNFRMRKKDRWLDLFGCVDSHNTKGLRRR